MIKAYVSRPQCSATGWITKPAAHVGSLSHSHLKWVLVECHRIGTDSLIKTLQTPLRVKRKIDYRTLFTYPPAVKITSFQSALVCCTSSLLTKSHMFLIKWQEIIKRMCQNNIMLSLCHYLCFLFLFCFYLSFWQHCQSTSQKMLVSRFFSKSSELVCIHFLLV